MKSAIILFNSKIIGIELRKAIKQANVEFPSMFFRIVFR